MKTFLSIDIDFWNELGRYGGVEASLESLNLVYKQCRTNSIPLSAVANHNQMLSLVNKSKTNQLINIDYHSDLATNDVDILTCGTWVSYVKQRKQSKYKWLHLNRAYDGDCNGREPIFEGVMTTRKQFRRGEVDWFECVHAEIQGSTVNFKKLFDRERVSQVCICESPSYTNDDIYEAFIEWRKVKDIPYTRGLKFDSYEKTITPK